MTGVWILLTALVVWNVALSYFLADARDRINELEGEPLPSGLPRPPG